MSTPVTDPESERELITSLRAFNGRTKIAAAALYTNIHACVYLPGVPEAQCAVAQNLYALAGTLHVIISAISPSSSSNDSSPPSFKLSPQDVEMLKRCIALCEPVLESVDAGVKVADEYVNPNSTLRLEKGTHRLGAFPEGAVEERRIVQTSLHELIRLTLKFRSHLLEKRTELTDAEAGESLRLETALKHADLNKSITAMSLGHNVHFVPQVLESAFPRSIIQMDAIPPQPYRRTEYRQSLSYSSPNSTPNPALFQGIMGEAASKSAGEANPADVKNDTQPTPGSTRESTPAMDESFVDVSATTSGAQQAKDTSGTAKGKGKAPADNRTEGAKTAPVPPVNNATNTSTSQPRSPFALKPLEHLEVYVMHPHADSFADSITWTSKIDLLRLHQAALDKHLQQLDPDHSIITELSKLPPHQVRLIQGRARSRQGHLVSVQQGRLVDVVTLMGTFQVRQVIFGLVTTQPPEVDDPTRLGGFGSAFSGFGQSGSRPFGGFNTTSSGFGQPHSGGLFGQSNTNNLFQTNGPVQESRFTLPTRGLFGQPQPATEEPLFKSAQAYETHLRERGEDCFLVEKDGGSAIQNYMTITTGPRYTQSGDHSLEEIRVQDYAAGREGPSKVNPFLYSWENPIRTQPKEEKAFGGQYANPKPRHSLFGDVRPSSAPTLAPGQQHSCWAPSSSGTTASTTQQPTSGGLFGNFGASAQTQQPSGGLFGNLASSSQQQPLPAGGLFGHLASSNQQQQTPSGGLFGNLAPANQQQRPGGLFGNPDQRPLGGLFGNATSSPKPPSGRLFGNPASSTSTPEPKQSPGGLFGNLASSSAQPSQASGSLFGNPASPTPQQTRKEPDGGLFPASTSPHQPQQTVPPPPQASSDYSASSTPQPQARPASPLRGLFGVSNRNTPAGSLFSTFGPGANNTPPRSVFGQPAPPEHFRSPFATLSNSTLSASANTNAFLAQGMRNVDTRSFTQASGSTALPSLFGTPAPASSLFGNTAASATASVGAGAGASGNANLNATCTHCSTSLRFHPIAEQLAAQCDACAGATSTTCWLCERKIGENTTNSAPAGAPATSQSQPQTSQAPADAGDEARSTTPSRDAVGFAKYKGDADSPFAALKKEETEGRGFSFGKGKGRKVEVESGEEEE